MTTLESPVRNVMLETDRGRFAACRAGSGEPVVLVGGYLGSKEDFAPLLPLLAAAGYAAWAVDHHGQHESPGSDDPSAYTLSAMAQDLLAVVGEVGEGEPAHVVAHCAGAAVAHAAAVALPRAVRSFAPLGSLLTGSEKETAFLTWCADAVAAEGAAGLRNLVDHWVRTDPDRADLMRTRLSTTRTGHLVGFARLLCGPRAGVGELAGSGVPLLFVHGVDDEFTGSPEEYQRTARRFGRDAVAVEGAGHCVQLDRPQETAEALIGFWHAVSADRRRVPAAEGR
ncbi:alpha/beta fold hydrolase [Amycolatopsis thermoflava]|uniref:Pimeloyl-ACP methyl ester carboxylesterase n=1 Tax=Amycolatopsis thermoflava TaxID=84480 RepID=A0A3N2H1N3_9PSEU|nr:alpha/beta hydrolase [Amycolatopsis thermoflava]ROS42828.1 pimeloyl-ACP methyl ester carboxylesterase [Amycolatopsis thermoflava]